MENKVEENETSKITKKSGIGYVIIVLIGIIIVLASILTTVLVMNEKNDEKESKSKISALDENKNNTSNFDKNDITNSNKENNKMIQNTSNKINSNSNSVVTTTDNIKIETMGITKYGDFVVKVTNENEGPVCVSEIKANFKDQDGNFAYSKTAGTSYIVIPEKASILTYFWGYDEDYSQYADVSFQTKISSTNVSNSYAYNGIELKSNNTGKQIAVTVKNNSGKKIERVKVVVAYYQGDTIVGVKSGSTDSSAEDGGETYINVEYPSDSNYKEVQFDKFEVYCINASID